MNSGFLKYSLLLVSILFFVGCTTKKEEAFTLRASLWANENHTWFAAFQHFKTIVDERSEGRLKIEVYPSEQLAKEIESIRLIQADVIDMTVTASLLSNWIEIANFCEMPFLLKDSIEKDLLLNGPIGKRVEKEMLEKVGLRPLAVFERGPRQLTSNRPIKHPDDLKGLIIRVPNVPTFITAWSALGAKPTPMAFSEVFTGLQQGTVEAQENPFALILSSGYYEVQKYVNMTNHVMSWSYPVIGEKQYQRLPDDLKIILKEAALEMARYEHKLYLSNEKDVKTQLLDRGMEFITVDNEAFKARCEQVIFNSLSPEMQVIYNDFQAELAQVNLKDN
ncbi:TRAP transporter substrate-binding protein [Aureibaculum algae]|uniref:TRAP transporter substrate-binding protein n=1 Tax=Aureibaculum algae TaxID=2584122 RepID=A0A5B7TU28_9FLAO|nr:TRAP transporter substrate-binding protein [Aureibaculum algae]QCX40359.1 TRAP transporter substrate-binding protein [Aureibaculum algae]